MDSLTGQDTSIEAAFWGKISATRRHRGALWLDFASATARILVAESHVEKFLCRDRDEDLVGSHMIALGELKRAASGNLYVRPTAKNACFRQSARGRN